jgi:mannose-6-phosphate isomerase-like protein (cupin superfamily)
MSDEPKDVLKIALTDAKAALAEELHPYLTLFEREDARVLLFAPRGEDVQTPHTQDELYVIVSGSGTFRRGEETTSFAPGDVLFVPARMPHKFEKFSDDLVIWVVFYGPQKSA